MLKFFDSLKSKAKQFAHFYESMPAKPTIKNEEKEERNSERTQEEKEESDKEKIRKKLGALKKTSSKETSNSSIEGLKSLLNSSKPSKNTGPQDIKDVIKVDSEVLNYGVVNPGKLLGSILNITNMSEIEQVIDISIDNETEVYDRNEIMKKKSFDYIEELTNDEIELSEKELAEHETEEAKNIALEKKKRFIPNSEVKTSCWTIENPKTKELTKNITLKLGPKCEQDFIIVLKTELPKYKTVALSFLNLELKNGKENYKEKSLQKIEGDSVSITEKTKSRKMQVMVCGVVDPPYIV